MTDNRAFIRKRWNDYLHGNNDLPNFMTELGHITGLKYRGKSLTVKTLNQNREQIYSLNTSARKGRMGDRLVDAIRGLARQTYDNGYRPEVHLGPHASTKHHKSGFREFIRTG